MFDAFQNISLQMFWSFIVVILSQDLLVQTLGQIGCFVLHLLCISATARLSLLLETVYGCFSPLFVYIQHFPSSTTLTHFSILQFDYLTLMVMDCIQELLIMQLVIFLLSLICHLLKYRTILPLLNVLRHILSVLVKLHLYHLNTWIMCYLCLVAPLIRFQSVKLTHSLVP